MHFYLSLKGGMNKTREHNLIQSLAVNHVIPTIKRTRNAGTPVDGTLWVVKHYRHKTSVIGPLLFDRNVFDDYGYTEDAIAALIAILAKAKMEGGCVVSFNYWVDGQQYIKNTRVPCP